MSHHTTLPANPLTSGLVGGAFSGLTAKDTAPTTGATSGTSTSSTAANSTSSLDTTFLSLLVQELQNQDPTAPMDSTAMVGQMISLNQLDQLTSINQTLGNAYPSTAGSATSTSTAGTTSGTDTKPDALAATQAALRLLSANASTSQRAVSPSVTLPAF